MCGGVGLGEEAPLLVDIGNALVVDLDTVVNTQEVAELLAWRDVRDTGLADKGVVEEDIDSRACQEGVLAGVHGEALEVGHRVESWHSVVSERCVSMGGERGGARWGARRRAATHNQAHSPEGSLETENGD